MSRHSITLFMWSYQHVFRDAFEDLMEAVMNDLGVDSAGTRCLLVGVKIPESQAPHKVCVEPEDGQWPVTIFAGLPAVFDENVKTHHLNNLLYGDVPRTLEKPELIRRDSARMAVQASLRQYDEDNEVRSFAGASVPVGDYYVVPVVQIPNVVFERFPPLREPITDGYFTGMPSLTHAAVAKVLEEASDELQRPHPGRYSSRRSASASEIAKRAASLFMYTPGVAIGDRSYGGPNLFERFNLISSLMYEGAEGKGRLLLVNLKSGPVDVALELAEPVPFREPRWARKVLQMASTETALLANCESILGLGNVTQGTDPLATQNIFEVEFHDHYHWSLSCGGRILLVSEYGVPSLPRERFPKVRLKDTFRRLFPDSTTQDVDSFTALFDVAVGQRHGSMLVVAQDAAAEATRLHGQGTKITPTKLTPELFRRVSNIDGTIIIDPKCTCYAVGVILDGSAKEECTPSRGARYNSGIRYVVGSTTPRLAIVVSDDGTVDVIPVLLPRIRRLMLEESIAKLEGSTADNFHEVLGWLDSRRFYLDESQCSRVNAAMLRLQKEPMEEGELRVLRPHFEPDPRCSAEYFEMEAQ